VNVVLIVEGSICCDSNCEVKVFFQILKIATNETSTTIVSVQLLVIVIIVFSRYPSR